MLVFFRDQFRVSPASCLDLKEAIVKGLGFQAEDFKISGFDLRDALVGQSVAYEFDVEIGNKVVPLKLLEDVNRWEYVDLPIFRKKDVLKSDEENGLVERRKMESVVLPVLAPFQLAGPMELWIQDAKDMRLSLPELLASFQMASLLLSALAQHDVDAGELRKVILADGAVVAVKGALLSLRIVGPTSLTSPSSSSPSSNNKLKLKRLAPGFVELSSPSKAKPIEPISAIDLQGEATCLLTPDQFTTLWPLTSINGSNSNLRGFEALLSSVLGPKADEAGSFKLLKADVSAHTFVKIGFGVEKKLKEVDGLDSEGFPKWRMNPDTVRMHFEVLAKVDGDKVVPERVMQVDPVIVEDTPNVLLGNTTMSKIPIVHPPPNPFTL
ncbi:tunicamycin induced protein [Actinidia rufa]|uniref:Tunicamycin induced protein n=1 Tax=Actinidia rufa TaxID=165716 RepID=A0A7J0F9V5_9ERIC|nr:tunicamycin induced protein [Actinidia rufa]